MLSLFHAEKLTCRKTHWTPKPVFSAWGSWTMFGATTSRYFMRKPALHMLHSSFRWGSLRYSGFLFNGSRYKNGWKTL